MISVFKKDKPMFPKGISGDGFNWRMMHMDLVVGEFIRDGDHIRFIKDPAIQICNLPDFLQIRYQHGYGDESDVTDILYWWITDRTFPPTRYGLRKTLKACGLHKYNAFEQSVRVNCTQCTDSWWIATRETDSYEDVVPYYESYGNDIPGIDRNTSGLRFMRRNRHD